MFQDQEKISSNQAFFLILAGAIGNIFTFIAVPAIEAASRDAWFLVLFAYLLATCLAWLMIKLGSKFPDKTIIQFLPELLGRVLGKLIALILILNFWFFSALIYRESADVFLIFMPETPGLAFIIFIALLTIYVMFKGFEVFTRVVGFLMPLAIFFMLLGLFFIIAESELNNLVPVFADGIWPIMKGLPRILALAVETVLFMGFWLPALQEKKDLSKALYIGLPLGGIILAFQVGMIIAFSGKTIPTRMLYSPLYIARYIMLFDFLTGFEVLYITLFLITSFFQIMVFFYPAVIGLAQWLNLKTYQPLIIPMTVVAIAVAMIPANIMEVFALDEFLGVYINLPLALLIPILLLIALVKDLGKDDEK